MLKKLTVACWLICALAMSGCKTAGPVVSRRLADPPPSLMQPPETEKRGRRELFKPQETQTPKSGASRT